MILSKDKIIIIDFGSQYTQLIARRIRELFIYCEIITLNEFNQIKDFKKIKGIILSGGPSTVTSNYFPSIDKKIFLQGIPILGNDLDFETLKLLKEKLNQIIKKENSVEQS